MDLEKSVRQQKLNYEHNLRKFGFPVKNKTVLEMYKQKNNFMI